MQVKDNFYHAQRLAELIKIKTVSSNANASEEFEKFRTVLKQTFLKLFSVAEVENFDGSLLLKIKGSGNELPVMFMNHYDVVEAGEGWLFPPYSGAIAQDKIFGRGTLDTKGGLYSMFEAMEQLLEQGFVPQGDIYLETSSNEETTGEGANKISKELERRNVKFRYVLDEGGMIVEEPIAGAKGSFALIGVGEKSSVTIKFSAKSKGGHASTPPKNSPLVRLAKFMVAVENKKLFKVKLSKTVREMFKRISTKMANPLKIVLSHPLLFAPIIKAVMPRASDQAGAMLKTTVAFTMARASEGDNVIPDNAYIIANIRVSHHQGYESSVKVLKKLADKYGLETEVLDDCVSSPLSSYKSAEFKLIEDTISEIYPEVVVSPYVMTGASDCRFMANLSKNCLRFTPFKVNDEQLENIHGKNENIDLAVLSPAVEFYKRLMQGV